MFLYSHFFSNLRFPSSYTRTDLPIDAKIRPSNGKRHSGTSSTEKTALVPGSAEVLIYSTLLGAIGCLYPFTSKEDIDFFHHLEMFMRSEKPPLSGREHIMYRSYYFPVQNCVDGDLCEQYTLLPYEKQRQIAQELDRTPAEILKKLEDMRNRIL